MMEQTDIKIEFVQPAYAKYREELYKKLSQAYDVRFHFLSEISPGKAESVPRWLDYIEYGSCGDVKTLWRLLSMIRSSNPDVIITSISDAEHTLFLSLASKYSIIDAPIVLWSEEWRPRVSADPKIVGFRGAILKRPTVSKFVIRNVNSLLLPHQRWLTYWKTLGAQESNTFYVSQCSKDYNTRQTKLVEPDLEKKTVFLYLGNIIERKGLDILIRSFRKVEQKLDNVYLLVVGDGPFRSHCEMVARRNSVSNIRFTGRVPEEDLASYYMISDAFVLPSCLRGHYEPCPISINESMSMKLPVITTNEVGSAGWLVRNSENGYVVEEQDVDELAIALEKLADKPSRRRRLGNRSREIFEKYNDINRMFRGFSRGIEHATSG